MGSRVYVKGKKKYPSVTISFPYIAGLFDGEGCIVINKRKLPSGSYTYWLGATLTNVHLPVLLRIMNIFGGSIKTAKGKIGPIYRWETGANVTVRFLEEIYSFLVIKKDEAFVAINFQQRRESYGRIRGAKPTKQNILDCVKDRKNLQELKIRRWYHGQ